MPSSPQSACEPEWHGLTTPGASAEVRCSEALRQGRSTVMTVAGVLSHSKSAISFSSRQGRMARLVELGHESAPKEHGGPDWLAEVGGASWIIHRNVPDGGERAYCLEVIESTRMFPLAHQPVGRRPRVIWECSSNWSAQFECLYIWIESHMSSPNLDSKPRQPY